MKSKYLVTFYHIDFTTTKRVCTRTRKSTRKFAFKHLFTRGIVFFTIKNLCNQSN